MESITRWPVKSVAAVGVVSILAFAGLALSVGGMAHAATGLGSVKVSVVVSGGTANPSDFTVQITKNGATNTGTLSGSGDVITFSQLTAGTYTLSESGPSGYRTSWSGNCSAQGTVTIGANAAAACTATNTFGAVGSIKVTQIVSGGTAKTLDFTVHLKKSGAVDTGSPSGSGDAITFNQLIPGAYTIIQSGPSGYNTSWSGACNAQGAITVAANATALCTITNTVISSTGGNNGGSGRTVRPAPVRPAR